MHKMNRELIPDR